MNQTQNTNTTSIYTAATSAAHQNHETIAMKPRLSTSDTITLVIGTITIAIALVAVAVQIWECYNRRMKVNILKY